MKILVQKFGGTSVATQQRREMVCDKVIEAINKGYNPVVVVSAIGRKGDPYATDTLLSLIENKSTSNKREIDLLMCCGEIISAVVLSETFLKKGYKTVVLTGGQAGIITDNNFGNAEIKTVKTSKLIELLSKNIIPIVTGFQGMTENGDFTTLGRGGSDVTGAVLGDALKAEAIEIYTDVDGIMTADPRIVPDAKVIEKINYSEVFQFADQGAKVIHPRAVEYAMRGNVPLLIKNTMSNAKGTVISSEGYNKKLITGITHMPNRTQISIFFEDDEIDNNELFDLLADYGISIDLINIFPNYKVFTIDGSDSERVKYILDLKKFNYKMINNCSKIAAIGSGIRGVPGVMAKILKTLKDNEIKVLQTADSHTTIWCLVKEEDTVKAINALHKAFEL
ncbi:aspartate kinase [Caloramator quimbayensis]|uniref:Aspartokinase n=1 Tax=Caloramator quimbayensis TaxID=1147123 RepID=A0A1T4XCE0_9CLOT|nr:aspartate kinase [Caloramator quimbayensis]SKA86798.1 aspartate kinase [Caloramator quimbayensis]